MLTTRIYGLADMPEGAGLACGALLPQGRLTLGENVVVAPTLPGMLSQYKSTRASTRPAREAGGGSCSFASPSAGARGDELLHACALN
jgi:hypothetical protein